jgi:hypothetical protein
MHADREESMVYLPEHEIRPDITQDFLINKVPVDGFPDVPPVLGTPLLTLFADLWSHESDTGLPASTVSQFAFCLVSCFSILESANTVLHLLWISLLLIP